MTNIWATKETPAIFYDCSLKCWVIERFTDDDDFMRIDITAKKLEEFSIKPTEKDIAKHLNKLIQFANQKLNE